MNIPYKVQNALHYGACEERIIENLFAECCYERQYTFFSDLSIAEYYGLSSVKDTVKRVVKSWFDDTKGFTEFIMCVNHKAWEHYERKNIELSEYYSGLYHELVDKIYNNWDRESLDYFYQITD